jgi:hypothetical protein
MEKRKQGASKMKNLFFYRISPIDNWIGWVPIEDLLLQEPLPGGTLMDGRYWPHDPNDVMQRLNKAKIIARRRLGWEGDIREGPYVCPLPMNDYGFEYLIAWKQDNNGTTFVVSPCALPWLEEDRECNSFIWSEAA